VLPVGVYRFSCVSNRKFFAFFSEMAYTIID